MWDKGREEGLFACMWDKGREEGLFAWASLRAVFTAAASACRAALSFFASCTDTLWHEKPSRLLQIATLIEWVHQKVTTN